MKFIKNIKIKYEYFKKKIKEKKSIFGTWSGIPTPVITDIISNTKLDFIIIDLEHGFYSFKDVENAVKSAEGKNLSLIIRTQDSDKQHILKCLETGTRSILVPHVSDKNLAEHVVKSCYYKPLGERGLSPYTRVHNYDDKNLPHTIKNINNEMLVGGIIEGKSGIENFEEICKVKGLDLLYIGLFDLVQSLGLKPGTINQPKLQNLIKKFAKIAKSNNKILGCMSNSIEQAIMLKRNNVKFIAYLNDAGAIKKFFDKQINKID